MSVVTVPAFADVVSAAPDATAVTIYRDEAIPDPAAAQWGGYGLAMLSETRTLDLPAGETRLVFEGVADGILPQTAALAGFPGRIFEQNFDEDLLSPATLIEHSVGRTVHLVRLNPRTGKQVIEDAVLRSGPDGVMLDLGDHVEALQCSGGPEGIVFDGVPSDLTGKPTLSIRVRVEKAGRYQVRLSYLTINFAWKAAYVAHLAPDGSSLDLTGWLTLANHGETSVTNAPTAVVAGRLARQAVELAQRLVVRRQSACWPMGNSHHPIGERLYLAEAEELGEVDELAVTAARREMRLQKVPMAVTAFNAAAPPPPRAKESDLGDYKLYTLDEPTTVAAKQTKQVAFISLPGVKFDTFQVYRVSGYGQPDAVAPTTTTLRFVNKSENGLGHALPAGDVSFRQAPAAGASEYFVGEHEISDIAVGGPMEIEMDQSSLVTVQERTVSLTRAKGPGGRSVVSMELTATNSKRAPAVVEIRQPQLGRDFKITQESQVHGLKSGDPVWHIPLQPGAETTLTYTMMFSE
ncbi:MAG: DUF4139 domain-containing protein [Caulobacterales bacterium]